MYIPRAGSRGKRAVLYWIVDACGCTCKFSENFVRMKGHFEFHL